MDDELFDKIFFNGVFMIYVGLLAYLAYYLYRE